MATNFSKVKRLNDAKGILKANKSFANFLGKDDASKNSSINQNCNLKLDTIDL